MRLTDDYGQVRTHRSLTRPDRRLMAGCDRDRLFDVAMFGLPACILALMHLNVLALLIAIALIVGSVWYLSQLAKLNPYFFPIYKRANLEQTVYRRSSHQSARIRPIPDQQSQQDT